MSICDCCGEDTAEEVLTEGPLEFGSGKDAVVLRVALPVIFCSSCDIGYTDARGEVIREKAVTQYLNVLRIQRTCDHDWETIDDHRECTYGCGAVSALIEDDEDE